MPFCSGHLASEPQAHSHLGSALGLYWLPDCPLSGGLSNFVFSGPDATNTLTADYGNVSSTANVNNNYRDFAPRLWYRL